MWLPSDSKNFRSVQNCCSGTRASGGSFHTGAMMPSSSRRRFPRLMIRTINRAAPKMPADPNTPVLWRGASGGAVTGLQKGLLKFGGVGAPTDPGPADGDFGPRTETAAKSYQEQHSLAADGVVIEGESALDRSLLTGEPIPVEVAPGADVAGATVNTYGRLVVRATKVGADTALAQIARLVEQAQSGKAPVQRLADRVSAVFVPIVIVLSLLTLVGWLAFGSSVSAAFNAASCSTVLAFRA